MTPGMSIQGTGTPAGCTSAKAARELTAEQVAASPLPEPPHA